MVLTLEIGTSSVRSGLFDRRGINLEACAASLPTRPRITPDGGFELDPDELVRQAHSCLSRTLLLSRRKKLEIAGVGLATFWHSVLGVSDKGEATTPLFMWPDTRSEPDASRLARLTDPIALQQRTGAPSHSSFLPAKFLWLKRVHPALFRRARWWMSIGEYLYFRWFGQPCCSHSMASGTGLLNLRTQDWDDDLLALVGIRREKLTAIQDAEKPVGGAERGRLPSRLEALEAVPWFPPMGDGACSNIGCGCLDPSRVALMIGTSGAMRVVTEAGRAPISPGLFCYLIDRRRSVIGGSLSNAGNVVAWLHRTLRLPPLEELERRVARMRPDSHGLTVLPFFYGERAPLWRGDLSAAVTGLRGHTTVEEITRACMESIAYRFGGIHDLLKSVAARKHTMVATGGGLARSTVWVRILADVLGRPVLVCPEAQASSRGVALLVMKSVGMIPSLDALQPAAGRTWKPNPGRSRIYAHARARQEELLKFLLTR